MECHATMTKNKITYTFQGELMKETINWFRCSPFIAYVTKFQFFKI